MCQCLCGRRFTWHLCLRCSCVVGIFPLICRDFLKNPLCMIAVNIPVYIYIRLCVRSAGVHDTISMCYIGRRDVSRMYFSANYSRSTAQPQQEKWNHHPSSRIIYKLYIFIHKCKKWFANCVEKQVKRMTWLIAGISNLGTWFVAADMTFLWHNVYY